MDVTRRGSNRGESVWSVADQAVSSLSNVVVSVTIARLTTPEEFGAFGIASTIYLLCLGAMRALTTEPMALDHDLMDLGARDRLTAATVGSARSLGVICGGLIVLYSLATTQPLATYLMVLGLGMPWLLTQDAWRFAFINRSEAKHAAIIDSVWLIVQAAAISVLHLTHQATGQRVFVAWGIGAAVAAHSGRQQSQLAPRRSPPWWAAKRDRRTVGALTAEYVVDRGGAQLALVLIGWQAGLPALGAIIGARVLLGPINLLYTGLTASFVVDGRQRRMDNGSLIAWYLARLLLLVLVSSFVGLVVLRLPAAIGVALMGATWGEARSVLPAVVVFVVAAGAIHASRAAIRVMGHAHLGFATKAVTLPLHLGAALIGARMGGSQGGAAGIAMANVAGAALWIAIAFRSVRSEPN